MAASGEALHIGGGTVILSSRSRETEDPADPRGITATICTLQVSRVVRGKLPSGLQSFRERAIGHVSLSDSPFPTFDRAGDKWCIARTES